MPCPRGAIVRISSLQRETATRHLLSESGGLGETICWPCVQAWSGLQDLQLLMLDHNGLSGYLPPSLGSLHQLRTLTLGEYRP